MPAEIHMVVKPYGLQPYTDEDRTELRGFKWDAVVKVAVSQERSPPLNRLYWGVMGKVSRSLGYHKEGLSHDLLIATRRVKEYHLTNGMLKIMPKRISQMQGKEFSEYCQDAFDLIVTKYLPGMSVGELLADVEAMLGLNYEEERNKI